MSKPIALELIDVINRLEAIQERIQQAIADPLMHDTDEDDTGRTHEDVEGHLGMAAGDVQDAIDALNFAQETVSINVDE